MFYIITSLCDERLGSVHKLRLQDKVGSLSKNVDFLSTFIREILYNVENVNAGG